MARPTPDPWSDHPPIVADDFDVPTSLIDDRFRLEPLAVGQNAADYEAWTFSTDHIRATPGYAGRDWPDPTLTLADNDGHDVDVRSWVRADRAELDRPVYEAVLQWLRHDWPFTAPAYARRA